MRWRGTHRQLTRRAYAHSRGRRLRSSVPAGKLCLWDKAHAGQKDVSQRVNSRGGTMPPIHPSDNLSARLLGAAYLCTAYTAGTSPARSRVFTFRDQTRYLLRYRAGCWKIPCCSRTPHRLLLHIPQRPPPRHRAGLSISRPRFCCCCRSAPFLAGRGPAVGSGRFWFSGYVFYSRAFPAPRCTPGARRPQGCWPGEILTSRRRTC